MIRRAVFDACVLEKVLRAYYNKQQVRRAPGRIGMDTVRSAGTENRRDHEKIAAERAWHTVNKK